MAEAAVIHASPLIFPSRGRGLHLLRRVADVIRVPEPVAVEIRAKDDGDPTARGLASTPWRREAPGVPTPPLIASWGLGAGESSVLALAQVNPGMEAIIDDLAGRRCAALLSDRRSLNALLAGQAQRDAGHSLDYRSVEQIFHDLQDLHMGCAASAGS